MARDYDKLRAERDFKKNPPKNEPGQGTDGWSSEMDLDLTASPLEVASGGTKSDAWKGGSAPNIDLNSDAVPPNLDSMGGLGGSANQNERSVLTPGEDAFYRAAEATLKGAVKGGKVFYGEIREAIKDNREADMFHWGLYTMYSGGSVFAVGLILWMLSIFTGMVWRHCLDISIGGMFAVVPGFIVMMHFRKKVYIRLHGENGESEGSGFEHELVPESEVFKDGNADGEVDPALDFDLSGLDEDTDEDDESDFGSWGDEDDGGSDFDFNMNDFQTSLNTEPTENIDYDDMINSVKSTEMPVNMYTRSYLVETFMKVLPSVNPEFYRMYDIPDDTNEFLDLAEDIREVCRSLDMDEDDIPMVDGMSKNIFLTQIRVERRNCKGKEQKIADELVNMYKYDEMGREIEGRKTVYATVVTRGTMFIINLFTSSNPPLITLADIYKKETQFIYDPKVVMPMIWGINEFGEVLKSDIIDTHSFIISGEPRSGKSWKVQSLLLQMCMFSSPKDINIYIYDMKDTTSDYRKMGTLIPHFKDIQSTKQGILKSLTRLTTTEAIRRKNILKENGVINIKDLKSKNPNVELPYLYIVFDEMMALASSFTKEEKKMYDDLLKQLVSIYPNLGFRVIFIPHRIKDEVISKMVYQLVGCRMCLKQQFEDMKEALSITKKDFPYSLCNKGDIALKSSNLNGGKATYCHAEAVSPSQDINEKIYKYVGEVWKKLVPGCDSDMVGSMEQERRSKVDRSFGVRDLKESLESVKDMENSISVDDILSDSEEDLNFWG